MDASRTAHDAKANGRVGWREGRRLCVLRRHRDAEKSGEKTLDTGAIAVQDSQQFATDGGCDMAEATLVLAGGGAPGARKRGVGRHFVGVAVALGLAFAPGAALFAEDDEDDAEDAVEQTPLEEAEDAAADPVAAAEGDVEEVVVTGSRLKRTTYSSISPLQIIVADVKQEIGLIDAGDILQESTASDGQQVDLTYQGFVLDDGPGTVTANLRGLGSARTLILINGRRAAPSGVGGAPVSPDLGIVPGSLVAEYDQLLDGASSIYGSDAVAGVVNIKLRKDFDGFEVELFGASPQHPKGDASTSSVTWGKNFDRGFVGFGAEYSLNEPVTLADRPWTAGCQRHVEQDQGGRVRSQDVYWSTRYGMTWDDCTLGALTGYVDVPESLVFYTPGFSNGGWPSFSAWNAWGVAPDVDGDGKRDVNLREWSLNGRQQHAHLYAERETAGALAYGEYTIEGEANLTPYFEVLWASRGFESINDAPQLFPDVPARNPFNICNPDGAGVDCGLAYTALITHPNYVREFAAYYAGTCARFGIPCVPWSFGSVYRSLGPKGPRTTQPVVAVRGDRDVTTTDTTTWRGVVGLSGDMHFLNVGSLSGWSFDASLTYSTSDSTQVQLGVRDDRLNLALGAYSQNDEPCVNDISDEMRQQRRLDPVAADTARGCVPVNMYAASLFADRVGDFATPAERDYVFGSRDFRTEYDQTLAHLYVTGTLFNMPAGPVAAGIGAEYRKDEIRSIPNDVAGEGLLFGYYRDRGAVGGKYTRELFAEAEFPLVGGRVAAREATLNLSARWTDDEFYGSAWTGSVKMGWRPVDSLLVRATWGTSFRAPNLRELFLVELTGFRNVYDPCVVPSIAIGSLTGEYDPASDPREPHVLENCRRGGVDPTTFTGATRYSVEVAAQGATLGPGRLKEETSESLSFGFSWEQSFTTAFDLALGASYYAIDIEDTIIRLTASYIVADCYLSEQGGAFCDRIRREPGPQPRLDYINERFINRTNLTTRGVDVNLAFEDTVTIFERPIRINVDITANRMIERSSLFVNAGQRDYIETHREWFYPERQADINLRLSYGDWFARWQTRYISKQSIDERFYDPFNHALGPTPRGDTCLGPPDDLLCRDVAWASEYMVHRASFGYNADTWAVIAGVRNVFDEAPPEVDGSEILSVNNSPIGAGYDLNGRVFFLNVGWEFGGD